MLMQRFQSSQCQSTVACYTDTTLLQVGVWQLLAFNCVCCANSWYKHDLHSLFSANISYTYHVLKETVLLSTGQHPSSPQQCHLPGRPAKLWFLSHPHSQGRTSFHLLQNPAGGHFAAWLCTKRPCPGCWARFPSCSSKLSGAS